MGRRLQLIILAVVSLLVVILILGGLMVQRNMPRGSGSNLPESELIVLPAAANESAVSVEQALWGRRSVRSYLDSPLTLEQAGQLLWSAQGVSDDAGHRTAPSAGALYPLEAYLVAGDVVGLEPAVYHYLPAKHALRSTVQGDKRAELAEASLNQEWMADAPVMIVISAVSARTNVKYGERTMRYVHMEAGAAAQNIYLQAEALNLGTVFIGAFYDLKVQSILELAEGEIPLVIMPVGK